MSNLQMQPPSLPPLPPRNSTAAVRVRKRQAFGLLDRIGQELEPTATQMEQAETAYNAVGEWLAQDPALANAVIYPQGSVAIGTAIKPIGSNEHDVDLICRILGYPPSILPATLKKLVGDRLAAHERYRTMLVEFPRCWRLNYAGEFHLDITPAIPNPACSNDGELVPDRTLKILKPSNPKGFRDLFTRRAALMPLTKVRGSTELLAALDEAIVEPFPTKSSNKGVLRRTVQILKRDRDMDFLNKDPALAPLSIIITTLASQAYEYCVTHHHYDNEFDLFCDTIRAMPWFIEKPVVNGIQQWLIQNETTAGENFAEKWNREPQRAISFYEWHARVLARFDALVDMPGLDSITEELANSLGDWPVHKAMDSFSESVDEARKTNRLHVVAGIGLSTSSVASTPVRANTFYGR